MKSSEYLESFLSVAKDILPDWMVEQIHDKAVPASGGRARANSLAEEINAEDVEKMLVEKEVVGFQDHPLADRDREWTKEDAIESLRIWAGGPDKEEMDWEQYRQGFLWYDPENEENFGSYKFPIAEIIDGEIQVVPQAVFASAAILSGALLEEGAASLNVPRDDIDAMKDHVAMYYEKMSEVFEDDSIVAPWNKEASNDKQKTTNEGSDRDFKVESEILKQDDEKRLVFGVVLEPEQMDAQGDMISAAEIEKTANFFMLNSQVVGAKHQEEAAAKIAQSYISPVDFEMNGELVKKGSWVLVTKILDDQLWKDIKKGKYKSYSVGGYGQRTPISRS